MTYDDIARILDARISESPETFALYQQRLVEGKLTRDENTQSHFCVYFLPYNPATKDVFIVHHKKSGLWIAPGGHIDEGETLFQALNREIKEELGVERSFTEMPAPFLLTITRIDSATHPCKMHFDIWFLLSTDGANFQIDPKEFHETRWVDITAARQIVTDKPNLTALTVIEKGV
ncbi:MAG: NUDIX domain-containing protein [Rectinemataceae bacterium]|nr:NUDIX domain-containing protein [Rectinemataceae bacterium]